MAHQALHVTLSPFAIWVFDLSSGALVDTNRAAAELYGYTREELLARTVYDICPLKGLGDRMVMRLGSQDVTWCGPALQRRKDGTTFQAHVGMIETGEQGLVAAVVVMSSAETDPLWS